MSDVKAFSAWTLEPLGHAAFARRGPEDASRLSFDQCRYLLAFALLGPSTHNSVPLAFEINVSTQTIDVYLRRQHVLPASDPTGSESVISIGCAIENLGIAAAQYGVHC